LTIFVQGRGKVVTKVNRTKYPQVRHCLGRLRRLAAILLATQLPLQSAFAEPPKAEAATASKTDPALGKPIIVLSYISSVRPDSMDAAKKAASDLKLGPTSCFACKTRENELEILITKTAFWLPYVYFQITDENPTSTVLLDPETLQVDSSGNLRLLSAVEGGLLPDRAFFLAYTNPTTGQNGEDSGAYTKGSWLMPIVFNIHRSGLEPSGTSWSDLDDTMKKPGVVSGWGSNHMRVVKREVWDQMILTTADKAKERGEAVTFSSALISKASNSQHQQEYSPDVLKSYRDILGPAAAQADDSVIKSLWSAELKFRRKRSESLADFYANSDFQKSLLKQSEAEEQTIRKKNKMMMGMMIAQMATFGASSAIILASDVSIMQGMNKIAQNAGSQNAEFESVVDAEVVVSTQVAGAQVDVSAKSIDELRAKFRDLLTR
jgi:hypothetical protein